MAMLMVFWVVSGSTMWLVQLKALRRPGIAVMTSALTVTALIWWGMYLFFTQ